MNPVVYRCGDCELDTANRIFRKGGTEYALEPKVFAVVLQLLSRPGELVTRDQLLDRIWGGNVYVEERTIDVHIRHLREKLEPQHLVELVVARGQHDDRDAVAL